MSKIRNIVVAMAIIGIINLPVCASSYEYVTVSPSNNEANATVESVGNLQPNETMTVNLFKAKNQIEPITFKTRFTGNNDNFYTELNVKL